MVKSSCRCPITGAAAVHHRTPGGNVLLTTGDTSVQLRAVAKVVKYECSFPPLLTVSHGACRHCPSLQEALPSLSCLRFPNTCLDRPVFLCVFAIHRQRDVRDSGGSFAAGARDKGCYDVVHGGKMGFVLREALHRWRNCVVRRSDAIPNKQQAA